MTQPTLKRLPSPRHRAWLAALAAAALCGCAAQQQRATAPMATAAAAVPAAGSAIAPKGPAWQRVHLGGAAAAYDFPVYANHALDGDLRGIREVVFVQHGIRRNGDAYYAEAAKLLAASGRDPAEILLIAPNFPAARDRAKGFDKMPLWSVQGWISGENAINAPSSISSLQVLDDLVAFVTEPVRFPGVERVTVAGHSGGGQLVHRYAVLNQIDERVRARGIALRYVVANPSSYLYFTPERPDGKGFARYDAAGCPTYDDYRYGLHKLVPYASQTVHADHGIALFERYARREVVYLAGSADNDPDHRLLDKACGAEAQGPTRLERARGYWRYERHLASANPRALPAAHQAYEVIGVGHNQAGMFGSRCGQHALFGKTPGAGAACRAPQP
jgi:hypothetical protein